MTTAITQPSLLRRLYDRIIRLADHPKASWVVGTVSFTESSFSPLPPDLLMIPMILADRSKAWWLAILCTVTSVVGGILGYAIGFYLFETIGQWIIQTYDLSSAFTAYQTKFQEWGFWIIVLKGLTPIPYKLVTIASGVASLNFKTFVIASTISRGFRFFFLAGLLWYYGPWIRGFIERYLGLFFAATLAIIVIGFVIVKLFT